MLSFPLSVAAAKSAVYIKLVRLASFPVPHYPEAEELRDFRHSTGASLCVFHIIFQWCVVLELNQRPFAFNANALPS